MTTLTWQTLLLLASIYFAGCCIGCLARRAVWRRRAHAALRPAEQPLASAVATAAALPLSDRADTVAALPVTRSAAPAGPAAEPFRRADTSAPRARPATVPAAAISDAAGQAARFEQALEGGGRESDLGTDAIAPAAAAHDDLGRIRAIDAPLEAQLRSLGAGTYAAIAQWTAVDIARISRELGFKGRIEQENWIEQAQILAKGGATRYAERLARGEAAAARPIEDEGEPRAPAAAIRPAAAAPRAAVQNIAGTAGTGTSPDVASRAAFAIERPRPAVANPIEPPARPLAKPGRDDLQRIRGIDAEIEALLDGQGVERYAQIASWTRVDTGRFDGLLGQDGRVARENWIEQAQILSKGGDTAFSREYDRRDSGVAQPAARAGDLAALRSVRSEAYRAGDAAGIGGAGRTAVPDDLKRVRGIGVVVEKRLNGLGITRYAEIAAWSPADVQRVSSALELGNRVAQENWIEQAQILSGDGRAVADRVRRTTSPQRDDLEPAAPQAAAGPRAEAGGGVGDTAAGSTDLAALRSVRSRAVRTGADAAAPASHPQDLKRIRGIGLLIEKALNRLGVTSYEHIANWTAADIDRVSDVLDFKGRIERENWVEQARILASGGQTEFSRRLDRSAAARLGP